MKKKVVAITGIGGIGLAIARRIGSGYKLLLADFATEKLEKAQKSLVEGGYDVETVKLNVMDKISVENFAQTAAGLGDIHAVVHTAGISPSMGEPQQILQVNLVGTARIIEAFGQYLSIGTVGIILSSLAGHTSGNIDAETRKKIVTATADELKTFVGTLKHVDTIAAYGASKLGNQLQVQAAAIPWGNKGARIVSVSPGIISTPMGLLENKDPQRLTTMLQNSPVKRIGTPEDIASIVEFLQSAAAGFITGTDFLVDGGVVALVKASNQP